MKKSEAQLKQEARAALKRAREKALPYHRRWGRRGAPKPVHFLGSFEIELPCAVEMMRGVYHCQGLR